MIKKASKITNQDFKVLGRPGQTIRNSLFSAKIFNIQNGGRSRFSFNMPKKVEKSAVLRNKAKRMGFLVLKKYLDIIKLGVAIQFVFNRMPDSKEELEKIFFSALNEAKIIQK